MPKNLRQEQLLNLLLVEKKLTSKKLADELDVSEDTIRRDIHELSKKGLLKKVRGGAETASNKLYSYHQNLVVNSEQKEIIAKKACHLIKNNMTIMITGGTTNLALSRFFPQDVKAIVYTYCLPVALELSHLSNIELFFLGGKIQKEAMVTIGLDVYDKIDQIKPDIAFIATGSISEDGITEESYEVSYIKKKIVASSKKVVSLLTSDKIDHRQSHHVCKLSDIDFLVTELAPDDQKIGQYIKDQVRLL